VGKNIIIFEPWGLGDLIFAIYGIRILQTFSYQLSVIANPRWIEWLDSLNFIKYKIPFYAPWADKIKKYSLNKYRIADINKLRENIKSINPDIIWDARGDIRHNIFLRLVSPSHSKILSYKYANNLNVYKRYSYLFDYLRLPYNMENDILMHGKHTGSDIVVFLGAYWKNRQVPISKAKEIIYALLGAGFKCKLILQPDDCKEDWSDVVTGSNLELIRTDIVSCSKIILGAKIVISTDSAWLHMAHYFNIPTVGLFSSLNADQWAPPNCKVVYADHPLPAELRYKKSYANIQPLENISIEKIMDAVHIQWIVN
jgi:ADP-heptose:LPS heptosyltransferase